MAVFLFCSLETAVGLIVLGCRMVAGQVAQATVLRGARRIIHALQAKNVVHWPVVGQVDSRHAAA